MIVFEILKMLTGILLFTLIGYFKECITVLIVMGIIKPFIGGYHEDSQIKCLIATIIIVGGIILLALNSELSYISVIILSLSTIFSIFNKAPIVNEKMPITRVELINKNRKIGIRNVIMLMIVALVLFNKSQLSIIQYNHLDNDNAIYAYV